MEDNENTHSYGHAEIIFCVATIIQIDWRLPSHPRRPGIRSRERHCSARYCGWGGERFAQAHPRRLWWALATRRSDSVRKINIYITHVFLIHVLERFMIGVIKSSQISWSLVIFRITSGLWEHLLAKSNHLHRPTPWITHQLTNWFSDSLIPWLTHKLSHIITITQCLTQACHQSVHPLSFSMFSFTHSLIHSSAGHAHFH